ncbi:MAG: alpha/beta fold hydrolase [Candidatus Acidiferrales bacterium]
MRFAKRTQTETYSAPLRFFTVAAMWMAACILIPTAPAQHVAGVNSGSVTTADKVKIHYVEHGPDEYRIAHYLVSDKRGSVTSRRIMPPTFLFVPGWTMPAWIWEHQITHFAKTRHVVAMDPRGQGESDMPRDGYFPAQRARDIRALIEQLKLERVVLVGWSMGVAEVAAYVEQYGTDRLAAVVLVDGLAGGYDAQFTAANRQVCRAAPEGSRENH